MRLLTVKVLVSAVSALGFMFSVAACGQGRSSSGPSIDAAQKHRVEQLYTEDEDDDALSRHDTAKIVSFFDSACVFVAPDGTRSSYVEWRQGLTATLARERHSQVRTTVEAVHGGIGAEVHGVPSDPDVGAEDGPQVSSLMAGLRSQTFPFPQIGTSTAKWSPSLTGARLELSNAFGPQNKVLFVFDNVTHIKSKFTILGRVYEHSTRTLFQFMPICA